MSPSNEPRVRALLAVASGLIGGWTRFPNVLTIHYGDRLATIQPSAPHTNCRRSEPMYVPAFSAVNDEEQARAMVGDLASAWLVTAAETGPPLATLMPILWHEDRVIAHMAKANLHWSTIADAPTAPPA